MYTQGNECSTILISKNLKICNTIGQDCAALGVDSKGNSLKQPMHPFHLAYGIGLRGSVARVRNKNPKTYIHTYNQYTDSLVAYLMQDNVMPTSNIFAASPF